jgi:histone-lysine N-methyltransferase ASH1L
MATSLHPEATRASSSDSTNSVITVDASPNTQSSSSTPPTSIGDSVSESSTVVKLEDALTTQAQPSGGRSRRARASVGTYNVKVLSGTAIHAPKKYSRNNGEADTQTRRRTISGDTLVGALELSNSSTETFQKNANQLVHDGIDALDLEWSVKKLPKSRSQISLGSSPKRTTKQKDLARRKSTRSAGDKVENFTKKLSVLGKRGRENFESGLAKAKRELRNLADTNEYAKIDLKPVVLEVWSRGKLVTQEPPKKKKKKEEEEVTAPKVEETKQVDKKKAGGRKEKVWLTKGLYAGQEGTNFDYWSSNKGKERERLQDIAPYRPNGILPMPMWHGQRLLQIGRDFKLPFDVCSPLPPGQPKPDEWRKTSSSEFHSIIIMYLMIATNFTIKIDSLVRLLRCGKNLPSSTVSLQNVSAHQKLDVMIIAKTESCFTNAMIRIAQLVVNIAPIELSPTCKNVEEVAASTELESK